MGLQLGGLMGWGWGMCLCVCRVGVGGSEMLQMFMKKQESEGSEMN